MAAGRRLPISSSATLLVNCHGGHKLNAMFVFRLCRRRILSSVLNQTVSSVKTCPLMYKRHFDEKDASKVTLTDKKLTSISKSELLEEPVQKQLELLDRSGIGSHHAQQYPQLLSVRPGE